MAGNDGYGENYTLGPIRITQVYGIQLSIEGSKLLLYIMVGGMILHTDIMVVPGVRILLIFLIEGAKPLASSFGN